MLQALRLEKTRISFLNQPVLKISYKDFPFWPAHAFDSHFKRCPFYFGSRVFHVEFMYFEFEFRYFVIIIPRLSEHMAFTTACHLVLSIIKALLEFIFTWCLRTINRYWKAYAADRIKSAPLYVPQMYVLLFASCYCGDTFCFISSTVSIFPLSLVFFNLHPLPRPLSPFPYTLLLL
jgi:hypothetical protein